LGVAPARLWGGATARIILSDPALDPSSAAPALRSFLWAGSTEQGAPPEPGEERPLVLVSLSATDWPGMLPVYRRIVAALTALPVEAVVTTGDVDLGGELRGSPNVTVTGWLDHTRVLPRASLLVGHGGHSTTLKALAHGVPVLTLPINPISDQRLIGTVIERHGLGATLPKRASTARLRSTISALLADPDSRERAARAGERLRGSARGAERAAAWVAALARRA
ncbi:glycosyltransferase, partial [Leucobacter sp. M11]|uniref:glycosyltransferase n=1 Tax=Leucobacter sp. M11 TaxID=2993565 RepID=UPI002D809191